MSDTVYVLGAGFSVCGGAPSQNNIMKEIYALDEDILRAVYWPQFNDAKATLTEFTRLRFGAGTAEEVGNIPLEDLFTVLDRALLSNEQLAAIDRSKLADYKRALEMCIVYLFCFDPILREGTKPFYKKLAQAIVEKRRTERISAGKQERDLFCFINLNWDIMLDISVTQACEQILAQNDQEFGRIDYCCDTSDGYSDLQGHVTMPLKSRGDMNFKMQKLHGSFNWLLCSNCGRLFSSQLEMISLLTYYPFPRRCPYEHCQSPNSLEAFFISPTLLKDLNNTHLKMVWHNAQLDLMEAKKVVFVGYSFPLADFELRYLLKRSVRQEAEVIVVLMDGLNDYHDAVMRYKTFFGSQLKSENIKGIGAQKYFAEEFGFQYDKAQDCAR